MDFIGKSMLELTVAEEYAPAFCHRVKAFDFLKLMPKVDPSKPINPSASSAPEVLKYFIDLLVEAESAVPVSTDTANNAEIRLPVKKGNSTNGKCAVPVSTGTADNADVFASTGTADKPESAAHIADSTANKSVSTTVKSIGASTESTSDKAMDVEVSRSGKADIPIPNTVDNATVIEDAGDYDEAIIVENADCIEKSNLA
ncbi:hypothetical protein AYI69_g4547 [Smittium culicis]|uniref:Uncharacterized protein n=1 Tax=Smittium culicis TaxID=133412 RepID=A0A1R1YCN1_9FUNG|nr:hypothetical protein AYI69_g4547 [Smittium culicis]